MKIVQASRDFLPHSIRLSLESILSYIDQSKVIQLYFNYADSPTGNLNKDSIFKDMNLSKIQKDLTKVEKELALGTCEGQVLTLLNFAADNPSFSIDQLANELEVRKNDIIMHHAIESLKPFTNISASESTVGFISKEKFDAEYTNTFLNLDAGQIILKSTDLADKFTSFVDRILEHPMNLFSLMTYGGYSAHMMFLGIKQDGEVIGYDPNRALFFEGNIDEVVFNLIFAEELSPLLLPYSDYKDNDFRSDYKTIFIDTTNNVISDKMSENSISLTWNVEFNSFYASHLSSDFSAYGKTAAEVVSLMPCSEALKHKILSFPFENQDFDYKRFDIGSFYLDAYKLSNEPLKINVHRASEPFDNLLDSFLDKNFNKLEGQDLINNSMPIPLNEVVDFTSAQENEVLNKRAIYNPEFTICPSPLPNETAFMQHSELLNF